MGVSFLKDRSMKRYAVSTSVFSLDGETWHVRIGNAAVRAEWNSKGAAIAGLEVECRRLGIPEIETPDSNEPES